MIVGCLVIFFMLIYYRVPASSPTSRWCSTSPISSARWLRSVPPDLARHRRRRSDRRHGGRRQNIIIYERIREELRAGKSARCAARRGRLRLRLRTVFDAHVTNLVAGVVLYSYGTVQSRLRRDADRHVANLFTSVRLSRSVRLLVNRRQARRCRSKDRHGEQGKQSAPEVLRGHQSNHDFNFRPDEICSRSRSSSQLSDRCCRSTTSGAVTLNYGIDFRGGTEIQAVQPSSIRGASGRDAEGRFKTPRSLRSRRPDAQPYFLRSRSRRCRTKGRADAARAPPAPGSASRLSEGGDDPRPA
jgi:hypothetical protein